MQIFGISLGHVITCWMGRMRKRLYGQPRRIGYDLVEPLISIRPGGVFQFFRDGGMYRVTNRSRFGVYYTDVGNPFSRHSLSLGTARRVRVICHGCK